MTTAAIDRPATRTRAGRPLRHAIATTVAVLAVCAAIGTISALSYIDSTTHLSQLSARAVGRITASGDDTATITWTTPTGPRRATVALATTAPPAGTRTQIAYAPEDPADAIIPGAALLARADAARSGVLFAALIALLVLATDAIWLLRRARLRARPPRTVPVRRIRIQRRLLSRTWLETDAARQHWLPVYFDPVLAQLPTPFPATLHGDPRRDRLIAVEITAPDGTAHTLYPSGRVATTEPIGRRTDSPSRPDEHAIAKARAAGPLRQLRVDAALTVPAPLVGLFWAYLDSGGFPSWLAASALTATLGLWWAGLRGSDPT